MRPGFVHGVFIAIVFAALIGGPAAVIGYEAGRRSAPVLIQPAPPAAQVPDYLTCEDNFRNRPFSRQWPCVV